MKYIYIFISALFFSSCCKGKGPQVVAALRVTYPNLSVSKDLKLIETEKNDISQILDTITLGELNSNNSYLQPLFFDDNSTNYILFVEGTSYQDTISDVYFEEDECKNEIINFSYKLNGDLRTETTLIL